MSLNCSEIETIISTLPQTGLINRFYSPDQGTIVISLYQGQEKSAILISATDGACRIHLTAPSSGKKLKESRFVQFCNSHLAGCRLTAVRQHIWSRIVIVECQKGQQKWIIYSRLWGSGSNIIVTDEQGVIVECLRRFPKRDEWPGETFILTDKPGDPGKYPVRPDFADVEINRAVATFYQKQLDSLHLSSIKTTIEHAVKKMISQTTASIKNMQKNLSNDLANIYKKQGELCKAYIHMLKKGMKQITLEDFESGQPITIPLKPNLDPAANIEYFFKKYRKLKDGQENWKRQMAYAREKELQLEILKKQLISATDFETLQAIQQALLGLGRSSSTDQARENGKRKTLGRKFTLDDKHIAYVSRSSREASEMLTRIARGNDYWFHIRDNAGSHVVVKYRNNQELTDRARLEAAHLALYYSKGRGSPAADIYFTRVKYLHRSKGGPYGLVFPTQEKNIQLDFDPAILQGVLDRENNV